MNLTWPEIIILGGLFFALVIYVWTNIANDLPEDFLIRKRKDK